MLNIYDNAKAVFDEHFSIQRLRADDEKKIEGIDKKYLHTMEVVKDGTQIVTGLDFNETFMELSKLAFLNHDIGRFEQMLRTATYNDSQLIELIGLNHGQLGKKILESGLIHEQIPTTRALDEPVLTIVNNHVDAQIDSKHLLILCSDLLKSADAIEFFNKASEEEKKKVISVITQIVQDVDRLDIYHQILEGRWTPKKVEEPIDPKVMDMFYNGQYLNMAELKKQGLWNANVGELVRLSFINQIKLLSVAKLIYDENILIKMKELRQNPYAKDAFDFMQLQLEEMIKKSDGITICKK